jgi:IS30 family transposase
MNRMAISLSPTERRERVALAANHAKSNRVLASELGVEESTIRRDRKFLLTPEDQRRPSTEEDQATDPGAMPEADAESLQAVDCRPGTHPP